LTAVDDHPDTIVDPTGDEPPETPVNIAASLGAVGYAAFALVQPIPLDEIVPFQTLMAAFEAEAAALAAPPAPASTIEVAPEPAQVPAQVPEPAYIEGGYRPAPVSESWSRDLQNRVAGYDGPAPRVKTTGPETTGPETTGPETTGPETTALAPTGPADDSVLREMAALGIGNDSSDQPDQPDQPGEPGEPGEEVPVDESFPAGGYAANPASVDSRARQVLDELSFLFDGK